MCLNVRREYAEKVQNQFKMLKSKSGRNSNPFIICYKIYKITPAGYLKSVIYESCIKKPRFVISDRKRKSQTVREKKWEVINKGIHVYRTIAAANGQMAYWTRDFRKDRFKIVPVRCYEKDFISANPYEAVFMKVEITEDAFKKAIGE